ncbi:MAG TPA: HlyD family secretion protein, partial [Bradyrhizobium sp.]|nr:HlyD family secretion protein [Bradyrhizobium sp.]
MTTIDHSPAQSTWHPPKLNTKTIAVVAALGIVAVLAVLDAWDLWPFASGVEVTDDAYIHGRTTVIAPQVSGYVVAVPVSDYAHVRAG